MRGRGLRGVGNGGCLGAWGKGLLGACGMAVVEEWERRLLETENGCYWGKRVRGKNFFIFF